MVSCIDRNLSRHTLVFWMFIQLGLSLEIQHIIFDRFEINNTLNLFLCRLCFIVVAVFVVVVVVIVAAAAVTTTSLLLYYYYMYNLNNSKFILELKQIMHL